MFEASKPQAKTNHEDEKQEFLAIISHELKTPLTDVKNYLSMILEGEVGPVSDEVKEYVAQAYTANDYLIRLVDRLTKVAKMRSGHIQIKLARVNLSQEIKLILNNFKTPAFDKGQTLKYVMPEKEIWVKADYDSVWEILINLLSNALKFTPKGGLIMVSLRLKDGQVIVDIKDNGPGIKKENQTRIFEIFNKVNSGTTQDAEGTGVGLYLAKELAQMQNGKLFLSYSEPGLGSVFSLSLPLD